MASHLDTHPVFQPGCYGCKLQTIVVAKGTTSAEVADITRREKQLSKDRDAYSRLRKDGLQPNTVKDSAHLESHVQDQVEIDMKTSLGKDLPKVKEILTEHAMKQWGGNING